jgi:hypothetical protein
VPRGGILLRLDRIRSALLLVAELGWFSLALSAPALLFVAANSLVPSDQSIPLREHFLANRTQFFISRGLLVPSAFATTYLLLDTPLLTLARLPGLFILAICGVGIASAIRRVQAVLAVLGLLFEILVISYLRFAAGSWAGSQ